MALAVPCLDRGQRPGCLGISRDGPRCRPCRQARDRERRPPPRERGYDAQYELDRLAVIGLPCELRLPGCTGWADTADHPDPLSRGGHRRQRLRPACANCNRRRGARDLED